MANGKNAALKGRIAKGEKARKGFNKRPVLSKREAIARDIEASGGEFVVNLWGERISLWPCEY